MQRQFKIGDIVSAIDDAIKGKIIAIDGNEIAIEDSDGFERVFQANELIVYDSKLADDRSLSSRHLYKENPKRIKREEDFNPVVIDLHHNRSGLAKHAILESQLRKFKSHLNKAIRNRVAIITFIPGVGEGILRNNIESILKKYHIKFSDAPYYKYGDGAIEVYLKDVSKTI